MLKGKALLAITRLGDVDPSNGGLHFDVNVFIQSCSSQKQGACQTHSKIQGVAMSDKFRNTGRTTRLIVTQVKQALQKQGETIWIHDHAGEGAQEERDRDVAHRVSQHLKFLGVEHDLNENRILVHRIKRKS